MGTDGYTTAKGLEYEVARKGANPVYAGRTETGSTRWVSSIPVNEFGEQIERIGQRPSLGVSNP